MNTTRSILLLVLFALISLSLAKKHHGDKHKTLSEPVPGIYIFLFKENATHIQKQFYLNQFKAISKDHKIRHEWQIGDDFHAFSAETSEAYVHSQLNNPILKVIEQDHTIHIAQEPLCVVQQDATWGLDRVSERQVALDGDYQYEQTGKDVDAYIIDTGILTTHEEFEGRAIWGATFTGDSNDRDCNGHGTHVAGTVGAKTWGIAKKVTLIAVKVLNCGGSGTWEGVIGGVNWSAQQYTQKKKPSVANMSLGGGISLALNAAVEAAVKAGLNFIIAAGNSNMDACSFSPASAKTGITVGSTDVSDNGGIQQDVRSSFSNYGTCAHMFAPGTMITSCWHTSNNAKHTISGTSMAAPHVCGVAALYLQRNPTATPADVKQGLIDESTKDVVNLNCRSVVNCLQSPNRMIYSACDL